MRRRGHMAGTGIASGRGRLLALVTVVALAAMALGATVALGGSRPAVAETRVGCAPAPAKGSHPDTDLKAPPQTVKPSDRLVAIIRTNCGSFEVKLDAHRSPKVVNSFVYLVRSGFYDGLLFYRVVPNFVIQAGSPHNNGVGGPGYTVTEPPPKGFVYRLGTVAMAKTALEPAGASGSTFFVVSGSEARLLPDEYAEFGRVTAGIATVKRIDALGTERERPTQVVRIDSIRIKRLGG